MEGMQLPGPVGDQPFQPRLHFIAHLDVEGLLDHLLKYKLGLIAVQAVQVALQGRTDREAQTIRVEFVAQIAGLQNLEFIHIVVYEKPAPDQIPL
jgi:hypothetical protein